MTEPHVMTAAEVFDLSMLHDYIWLEIRDEGLWHLQVFDNAAPGLISFDIPYDTVECKLNKYGKEWRCWTGRPTKAECLWTRWDQSAFWR